MVKILGSKKFEKIASANAEADSIFVDSSDSKLKFKDSDSTVAAVAYQYNNVVMTSALQSDIYTTCLAYCGSYGDVTPYDNKVVDIYTDSTGYLNTTCSTGNTIANYSSATCSYSNSDELYPIELVEWEECTSNSCNVCGGSTTVTSYCDCLSIYANGPACQFHSYGRICACVVPCATYEVNINDYGYFIMCMCNSVVKNATLTR